MEKIFQQIRHIQNNLSKTILKANWSPLILVLLGLFLLPACSGYQVAGNLLVSEKNVLSNSQEKTNPGESAINYLEPTPEWPGEIPQKILNAESETDAILQDLVIPEGCEVQLDLDFEKTILELINKERINKGLEPLSMNEKLQKAARQHSVDMACKNYFNHIDLDGNSFDERVTEQGYAFAAVGENIYAGDNRYNCPEQAYKGWYRSQRHYQVMFHNVVTEIGIGYAYNAESRYGGYFTADFAAPVADY